MRRSKRARLWTTWALRDARKRWVQLVSIGLLIALGVGMYSAMSSMSSWRTASADASFAALRMHDLRVSLAEGSYVPAGTLNRAVGLLPDRSQVAAAEERLVASLQVEASQGKRSIVVPGRIVGAPLNATVDRLATVRGGWLRTPADGQPTVELERNFAKHYGLPASGSLRLTGDRRVRYAGQVLAPEYFVVTAPGADFGAEANFAVLFSSLRTAQLLTGQRGSVNELVLRLRRGVDLTKVRSELHGSLRRVLPGIGYTLTAGTQEPARRLLYKDAEGDQRMMDIFAFLLLGAAALAAFNLVSRTVEAQRREIGIGMALGVPPRMLALRPLMLGGQVAFLGLALGIPVGFAASAWLRSVMESFFPLPVVKTPLHAGVFARAAGLAVAISLLATVLPLWRALSVSPVEAIRVGARAAKSSGLAWITRGLRLPGGSLSNMPLRNVLRAPRRTAITVLGIAAVVAITLALAGMIDSFNSTLDASRTEALAGAKQRLTVDLAAPQPQNGAAVRAVSDSPLIAGRQTSLRLPGTLATARRRLDAFVEAIPVRGPLWHPTLLEGTLPANTPGLLIAKRASQDLHAPIGRLLSVSYPVRTGPSSYKLSTAKLRVTGINASPLRFIAYVNEAAARTMGLAGLTNRLSVMPAAGRSTTDVKRALIGLPSITAVQGASATTDAVSDTMSQFTDVLIITVAIAVVMSFLIAYNSATINAEERTREHATLFAYGVRTASVLRGNAIEALFTGLLATTIGIGAGYAILRLLIDVSMRDTMPDLGTIISISAVTYALAALAGIVSVTLAPLLTLRRLRRTDIPSALRVVE
jgi:putative ABC transport system permease protein